VTLQEQPCAAVGGIGTPPAVDGDIAGERWRNALAELDYAERHGSPADEVEQLSARVIEARIALFQAGVTGGRSLPAHLRTIRLP
jgi:hypothetical protein